MKVGLIRCLQTEDLCSTNTCLKVMHDKLGAFKDMQEEIEVTCMNTCGGCPGKKAVSRAERMVKNGCNTIVIASCITKGTPIGFPCPHRDQMMEAIRKRLGPDIRIMDHSH